MGSSQFWVIIVNISGSGWLFTGGSRFFWLFMGNNPQRFFIGGTENWINRDWSTGRLPMDSPSDFVFLSTALPMRGYNYAEAIGTKYGLVNVELRFPFIRYLITGGLPLFFSNIMGTIFFDAGATWSDNSKLQLFSKKWQRKPYFERFVDGHRVWA